jgi:hypothetical protein
MKEIHELTASECLRERFDLEAALASAPSPTGAQLDCIENGLIGPGHNGARTDGSEGRQIRMLDLMNATKGLSRQEIEVCRLRYRTLARSVPYERVRRMAEIMEGDGETVIDPKPIDGDGKPMDGYVKVRGMKVIPAKDEEVARAMAAEGVRNSDGELMTTGAVKKRAGQALDKVGTALQWLAFKHASDGDA